MRILKRVSDIINFQVELVQRHIYDAQNIHIGVHCDINAWKLLTNVTKSSTLDDVWGPRYNTAVIETVNLHNVFHIAKQLKLIFYFHEETFFFVIFMVAAVKFFLLYFLCNFFQQTLGRFSLI